MKRMLKAALLATVCVGVATAAFAQLEVRPVVDYKDIYYPPEFAKPQIAPEIPFDPVDPHWFKLPPSAPYGQT